MGTLLLDLHPEAEHICPLSRTALTCVEIQYALLWGGGGDTTKNEQSLFE